MDNPESENEPNIPVDEDGEFGDLARRLDHLWGLNGPSLYSSSPSESPSFNRFKLQGVIGSGAFGVVYRAEDTQLKRQVALKLPRPEVLIDAEKRARFVREAELAARLQHPGIVSILQAELSGPQPFIASDYCNGPDLATWLNRRTTSTPWQECVEFIIKICEAVQYAHSEGVYHRDLKPANILLTHASSDDHFEPLVGYSPRITDFGLAKLADASMTDTRSSMLIGSPLYMAPEQVDRSIRNGNEAAADIYSLGVILYELLTGKPPVTGETYVEVLDGIRTRTATPVGTLRDDLPIPLQQIVHRCLEKNPAARYASVASLVIDLRNCMSGASVSTNKHGWWDRLAWWSSRPERMRDAGWFAVWSQAIWTFWCVFTFALMPVYDPIDGSEWSIIYAQAAAVIAMVHLPIAWIGFKTTQRKKWAAWLGFGLSLFHVPGFLAAIFSGPLLFPELYEGRNSFYGFIVYFMLLLCFSIQAFLFWCAVRARRSLDTQRE